ncbi:GNAT family N-acetyltransferase [Modestobacter sp. Leaf380]|uniref:GNAT family N-acetyltransferase n=1 Tax=Modestobacter sp. Leaf380 TaxID=1736356 RepID=UPI0006F92262|nr:GNAT family N-acetyltransferase [Modestobacter sp. Leaf380]KQS68365.1 hypothetical protein ASG41_05040 [Modestobacter sp. Leaf380]
MTGRPSDDRLLGGGLLFCQQAFHDLNGVPGPSRRRYEHRVEGRLVGVLDGVVEGDVLVSGHRAPFGGLDVVREDLGVPEAVGLVRAVVLAARADGLRQLRIRARPPVYSGVEPLLEYVLLHLGFRIEHCDLNHHLDVSGGRDPLTLLKDRKRRYVRAASARPHELLDVVTGEPLTRLHEVLAANRSAHGRPPPLPRDYLEAIRQAFPDRVRMRLLLVEGEPAAAAVVYRVLDGIDQVVHWADVDGVPTAAPVMELLAHLVTVEAMATGARLVDLGPSSEKDGSPNSGLAAFKRSVGAVPGTRKVFVRDLVDEPDDDGAR